jgi:hypothetical protein
MSQQNLCVGFASNFSKGHLAANSGFILPKLFTTCEKHLLWWVRQEHFGAPAPFDW